ncbi:glycosyltransferase family 4 protein [Palleronia rufa]|uniref:glycosyltransferase family 4 protein n=1 Tax=Palleronia rufa TaxID=1530186 RepID=UPI0009DEB53F|nr:glycosyltransferase family 4 protein [Palleronia rufa]
MSRIVLVQSGLGSGGTEKIVAMLAGHFGSRGHEVVVLAIHGSPANGYYTMPERTVVRSMEAEEGPDAAKRTMRRVSWLRKTFQDVRPDLIVSFLTKINIQTTAACFGMSIPRIASERNNFKTQPMHWLWRLAMAPTLAMANAVVMLTSGSMNALPEYARRRARVIPNPCPPIVRHPPISVPQRLIAVGRLCDQKGFDTLIRAVALARQNVPDLSLTIYGEGEKRGELEALRDTLELSGAVAMPGRSVNPHDWVGEGGIFALSSRYEGFPNVLSEALAHGFAIATTRCDWGPEDLIEQGRSGLMVPVDDARAMAATLERLWGDEVLRLRLAQEGVNRAELFCQNAVLSRWEDVVRDVLDGRHTHEDPVIATG